MGRARRIFDAAKNAGGNALFVALSRGEAEMKRRIFNDGKASDGTLIGSYRSDSHIAKRRARGRQIVKKDLQFEGDLIRSLQVGREGKAVVLGFTLDRERIKADGNEQQTGKRIFKLSKDEKILVIRTFAAEIVNQMRRAR